MELFIAIGLEKAPAERLVKFTKAGLTGHPTEHPDDLHVTLHYIGETACVNDIAERLSSVAYPPFSVKYTQLGSFFRQEAETDVIWQGIDDSEGHVAALRDTISDALREIPFQRADRFTPHITLSYTSQPFDAEELNHTASPLTGSVWNIREFQLWQVLPGAAERSFRKIASYKLSAETERTCARLLCVNDFHGALREAPGELGAAKLAAAVKAYKKAHPETEVVFGGDNCFGEPVADLLGGKPVLDMMRLLHVKATVLGNHDLDSPVDTVAHWAENVPLLAANLTDLRTGAAPAFVKPYEILTVNGYRIALIGLCTVERLPGPDHPESWADYQLTRAADALGSYTALLDRQKCGGQIDAVIALTHLGLKELAGGVLDGGEALEALKAVPACDGMFTAHFHQFLQLTIGRTAVAQGGCRGQGFSVLKLTFDTERRLLSVVPLAYRLGEAQRLCGEDPETRAMVEAYYRAAEPMLREVIFTAEEDIYNRNMADFSMPITGTPLTKLATDVMRQATGCPIAMIYAGRIVGAGFDKGPVTLYDFYKVYPFANILVTTQMTSAEIWENVNIGMRTLREDGASPLAVGGLTVTIDPTRPPMQRVLRIQEENGDDLRDDQLYPVVIEDYLASNPFGFRFPEGQALTYHNKNVRELMLQYFRIKRTVRGEYPTNIVAERGAGQHAGAI